MKKITKLTLTLAMLFGLVGGVSATKLYATYGSPASEGSWNEGTGVYSWTAGYSNLMPLFTFSKGELAEYTSINFSTDAYSSGNEYRLYFHGPNKEIAFYSSGNKSIVFADRSEFKGVDLSTVTGISFGGASASGSITITGRPYLEKPTEFKFDETGKAYLYPSDLTATGYGLDSWDAETGTVVKSTEGYGGIYFDFGVEGYDFSTITNIEINIDGGSDDIRDYANVTDLNGHTQYISATGGSYTLGDKIDSNIKTWNLGLNAKTGTMKINYICFTSKVLNACLGEEVSMTALTNYHWDGSAWGTSGFTPSYRTNETTGAAYFGVDYSGENCQNYSDVTGYKAIRIYSAQGNIPRAMFFNSKADNQQAFSFTWKSEGYYELLLSDVYSSVENYKLISVRPQQYTSSSISAIYMVIDDPVYSYRISGSGILVSSVTAALADATATSYDATGVTGTGVDLSGVANPNALFIATAGALSNTKNVIVSGTCANLALTDGYPFKAPSTFTVTAAPTYSRAFTASKTTTVCLPFALTEEEAASLGKFYEYSSFDGSTLHFSQVAAPEANTPYFVIPEATSLTLSESDKDIFATPAALKVTANNVDFIGTMEATTIPASGDTYSYYAYNNGDFVKITTAAATLPAFRAYFKVLNSAISSSAPALNICFDEFETTGIKDVKNAAKSMNGYYNLSGQQVTQPTKGLYIVNGKKVVIK